MKRFRLKGVSLLSALVVITLVATLVRPVRALAEGADDYRDMGSVAGIAAACYGSKLIPTGMAAFFNEIAASNAATGGSAENAKMMQGFVDNYKDAYSHAFTYRTVWDVGSGTYDKTPFNCTDRRAMEQIGRWEREMYRNLVVNTADMNTTRTLFESRRLTNQ